MYCSQCGKKVNDTMLFCPFCGKAIVIPDQDDEPVPSAMAVDSASKEAAPEPAPVEANAAIEAVEEPGAAEAQVERATTAEPEPEPMPAHADAMPEPEAPAKPAREVGEAEAELLDWDRSRRQYASGDEWANPEGDREDFAPLTLEESSEQDRDESWREEIARRKEEAAPEKKAPEMRDEGEPVRLEGTAPKLEAEIQSAKPLSAGHDKAHKSANTLVPPKQMNPNDIFMDGGDDAFDEFDAPDKKDYVEEEFVFEDADEGSFFMRHIRGIVGLALLVILLLMFVIFAFSKPGQQSLAKINLAWNKDTYTELGVKSFNDGQYAQAATYYERALQRDPQNYDYASSAVMAYEKAGNKEKEAEMLKRCIEIRPDALEPYFYLLQLYPSAAQRPWEITQLLKQGFERTGDVRLNVTG